MESDPNHFRSLNRDLVVDIMSKLDGCTLAAASSTCVDLRDAAGDERLWQKLCHQTWPSTSKKQISRGKFKNFYADSFPLILHKVTEGPPKKIDHAHTTWSPWDFISFIDIYHKGHCIFSRFVDGIIDRETTCGTCGVNFNRFLCYPFKLDLTSDNLTNSTIDAHTGRHEREELEDECTNIVGDLRLSWIIFDKRNAKAVNISSWRPRSICRSNSSDVEGYVICFGCIVTVKDSRITQELAECVITVKCKLMIEQGRIRWEEISLVVKDMDGSHLNGELSMIAMKQALVCSRSVKRDRVELGYQQFCQQKMELKLRNEKEDSLANILSAIAAIATLLGICYACATLL